MAVYRIDLAYDGTDFHGYASQPEVRTVQGELEEALLHHAGPVETFVAGRTDKGVHAAGQVVSFESDRPLDPIRVMRSLNRRLGPEIAVKDFRMVSDGFHARFSALARNYRYLVSTALAPDPFRWRTMWHYGRPLDVDAMNAAAAHFVGERDFASLCRKAGAASTVRDVRRAAWTTIEPELLAFEVSAGSFCHQMVRSMVAICVDAGRGKIDPARVGPILDAEDRSAGRGAAPPCGLTLIGVDYPEGDGRAAGPRASGADGPGG